MICTCPRGRGRSSGPEPRDCRRYLTLSRFLSTIVETGRRTPAERPVHRVEHHAPPTRRPPPPRCPPPPCCSGLRSWSQLVVAAPIASRRRRLQLWLRCSPGSLRSHPGGRSRIPHARAHPDSAPRAPGLSGLGRSHPSGLTRSPLLRAHPTPLHRIYRLPVYRLRAQLLPAGLTPCITQSLALCKTLHISALLVPASWQLISALSRARGGVL